MAKNIKDLLSVFNNLLSSNELSAILGASDINDVEIQDEDFDKIQDQAETLLTIDSAVTNKEVKDKLHKLHLKSFMESLEADLKPLADKLEASEDYKEADSAKKKIKILTDKLEAPKADPANDDETKKLNVKLKQQIADLNKQMADKDEETTKKITETQQQYETRLLKKAFHTEINNRFKLADAYNKPEIKQAIVDRIYNDVTKEAKLQLNESDAIDIFDKETPDSPYFVKGSNKPAGIEELVSPKIQDYLQVSKPEGPEGKQKPDAPKGPTFEPGSMADQMARKRDEAFAGMVR